MGLRWGCPIGLGWGPMGVGDVARVEDGRGTVRSLTCDEGMNFRAPFASPPWNFDCGVVDELDDLVQNPLRLGPHGILSSVQKLASEVGGFQDAFEVLKGSRLRFHAEGDSLIRCVPKADVRAMKDEREALGEAVVEIGEHATELSWADALAHREATSQWKEVPECERTHTG